MAASKKTPPTYGLTHFALGVADLDRTRRFYQRVFDMEVMYREADFIQLSTPSAKDILVFEKRKATPGLDFHFGFRLRKPGLIATIRKKIVSAGGQISDEGEFVPGSPYIFFKDPDGYTVEVWYEKLQRRK